MSSRFGTNRVGSFHVVRISVLNKGIASRFPFQIFYNDKVFNGTVFLTQLSQTTLWGEIGEVADEQCIHRILCRLWILLRSIYSEGNSSLLYRALFSLQAPAYASRDEPS